MHIGQKTGRTIGKGMHILRQCNIRAQHSTIINCANINVHPFMTTVHLFCNGYFQQCDTQCHRAQIMSNWFLEYDNEFTVFKWPPHSPELSPTQHLLEWGILIMNVQPTNLQQLLDVIMSIWTKISQAYAMKS